MQPLITTFLYTFNGEFGIQVNMWHSVGKGTIWSFLETRDVKCFDYNR